MNNLLNQILQLIIGSPGNLIYHLVLAFALMAGLQSAINQRAAGNNRTARRYITGFLVLLAGQVILFISSALVWQRVADPLQFLPVVDRAVTSISFLWLAWIWVFPKPNKIADTANIALNLLLLIFAEISLSIWIPLSGTTSFNHSVLDLIWTLTELLSVLAAIAGLVIYHEGAWEMGLGFFTILTAGILAHLIWGDSTQDLPALIRLAQICVYPLLPSLGRNLIQTTGTQTEPPVLSLPDTARIDSAIGGRKRQAIDTSTVISWLQFANRQQPQEACPALTQAVARSLVADMCFLVVAPDRQSAFLQCGFDLIREETLPGSAVDQKKIPKIANSLQQGKAVRILADGKDLGNEQLALAKALGLKSTCNLLAAPIVLPSIIWAGIIVLSPYSRYVWNDEDQATLELICKKSSALLAPAFSKDEPQPTPLAARSLFTPSESDIAQFIEERKLLLAEIESLRGESSQSQQLEMEPLLAVQTELRAHIDRLEADNLELREALRDLQPNHILPPQYVKMETDLRGALEEVARVQTLLAEANLQILNMQNRMVAPGFSPSIDNVVINNYFQELRQPVYSILGYVDLLNAELNGHLAAEQMIYLERIKSSTERMKLVLDDLNVSSFATSPVELAPQDVEFKAVIEQVISIMNEPLREKNILLNLDITDRIPLVYGDRDALQQIVLHLLQNAISITPGNGNITLDLKVDDSKKDAPFLVFSVTDEGGGVSPDDLGKVFTRSSLNEQMPIRGVGDSGLGLSITKTLVEAHGGRIWLETEFGKTTISVLMPLRASSPNEASQNL